VNGEVRTADGRVARGTHNRGAEPLLLGPVPRRGA